MFTLFDNLNHSVPALTLRGEMAPSARTVCDEQFPVTPQISSRNATMSQNYTAELVATARAISATGKGILAADESTGTIGKRFAGINVEVSFFTTT